MSAVSNKVEPITAAADDYLKGLGERVRMWRLREGKSCFSMPPALWDEVVAACRKYPLRMVSRETGVSRDELKRRAGLPVGKGMASAAEVEAALEQEAQFIEAPGIAAALAAASAQPVSEPVAAAASLPVMETAAAGRTDTVTVEVTAADGARLTLHVPVAHLNIQSLIQHFRGGL